MRRMRRKHHRTFRSRTILADGVHVFIELVKRRMRQPRFIKMQRPNFAVKQPDQRFHVIDDPVIGALRDCQNSRLPIGMLGLSRLRKRIGLNLLLDILRTKFFQRNRTNNPQMISCRCQKDRYGPRHDDRM